MQIILLYIHGSHVCSQRKVIESETVFFFYWGPLLSETRFNGQDGGTYPGVAIIIQHTCLANLVLVVSD